jgi:hypothetical protein
MDPAISRELQRLPVFSRISQLTSGGPKKLAELGSCNSIISGMIDIRSFSLALLDAEIQQMRRM